MRRQILSIAKKEVSSYFGSPLAIIFLGTFLAAELFIFFTVETFFVRGIADVRPLFRWMPILLIFLLAALTMRQWSEEQRSGTQELLLTLPVNLVYLVLGKFLAVMAMIGVALALTLPLPITVAFIGNIDLGPVIGGYLAALLMAGAYAAIGLFVSSRTDNQIVALISTVLLGGLFYLLGTRGVTDFVGGSVSDILWAIGTGSRFESIQRGVIDLRDLVYYGSLIAFFLMLNTVSLDSVRWSQHQEKYRRAVTLTAVLVGVNLIALNVWLYPLQGLRLDLTAQREYSLSQTTKDLFDNLQEPLLIRAYISEKTHPLLAPLVPQVRDMLREYEIAADGRLTAEVVDPIENPEIEAEANQTYNIRPTPFQISDRREASVINSYFDILIRYGDQTVVLNFQDLIQVDAPPSGSIDVSLRNLEYDLTSSIKKVIFGFQSVDAILAALDEPVTLTFFVTSSTLPETLQQAQGIVTSVATEIERDANGKFIYNLVDLDDPDSPVDRQFLQETYGLQPFPVSFFSSESYYAHMILQNGEELSFLYPPADLSEGEVRTTIESALKRTSSGFLKVAGIWSPPPPPQTNQFSGTPSTLTAYDSIRERLRQEYTVQDVDLSTGQVPANIDVLVVIGPQSLTEIELFAIDQYLMRGGSVTLALNNHQVGIDSFSGTLFMMPNTTGLSEWLAAYGIQISDSLVLDSQNLPLPVATYRQVGGFQVQEIQGVDYPYSVDVRPDGMDTDSPVVANLPAVTMNWVSPVELDPATSDQYVTSILLRSSPESWLRSDTDIQPKYEMPDLGFPVEGEQQSHPLAVSLQGSFESFFKDRPSPFETAAEDVGADEGAVPGAPTPVPPAGFITSSPESSRLVVIGSATFVEDDILNLSSALTQTQDRSLSNLQFMQNLVDWSVEDLDLLEIRARGSASRVLKPLTDGDQTFWEVGNYVVALVALLGIYYAWRVRSSSEPPMELVPVSREAGD